MRIGIVSKWFDRGQPVVGRYLRTAFEDLGHETFVLARPKKQRGPRPGALDRKDVWDQPGITEASEYDIPLAEYRAWVEAERIDAVFCDQNYQFEELATLRREGVRTVGRFVWEHFSTEHVAGAQEAFEIVYSFTHAEQERYKEFGINSPRIQWGLHPELIEIAEAAKGPADSDTVAFIYPGGFIGHRKPVNEVVEAFMRTLDPKLRLTITAQVDRKRLDQAKEMVAGDSRIALILDDLPRLEHLARVASCDVCVTPSRWEGLGLPLYEATAFGMPIVVNDNPPMNEVVTDGENGLLVQGVEDGKAKSGIPAFSPDVTELARAFERLADPELRAQLAEGSLRLRDQLPWSRTVEGFRELLKRLSVATYAGS
ncbi:MAG: glycosyltransferase family 4 protein [Solirubrobacterales bacterium]